MRHKVAGWKLGRTTSHRRSLLRNLATSLIIEERIETTVPKAKALRPQVEKMITLGKRGDLSARRDGFDPEALAVCVGDVSHGLRRRYGSGRTSRVAHPSELADKVAVLAKSKNIHCPGRQQGEDGQRNY